MTKYKEPDLKALKALFNSRDRDDALFFVGRQAEIDMVEEACASVLADIRSKTGRMKGLSRLIQGAPGAGKTSLLSELKRRWGEKPAPGTPMPITTPPSLLSSERELVQRILKALDPAIEEETRQTRSVQGGGEVGIPGAKAGDRIGSPTAPPDLTLHKLMQLLPPEQWTRPVCLLIDEAQETEDSPPVRHLLLMLHDNLNGLPIIPLFAGLGSSFDVLSERGLSRLNIDGAVHDIGRLAPKEAEDAVRRMLSEYRVDCRDASPRGWADGIARRSEGWPQHLHNGMRALAAGLVSSGGRLAAVDADAVLAKEAEWRLNSYEMRRSRQMRRPHHLVGALMAQLPAEGALEAADLINFIKRMDASYGGEDVKWGLPAGLTAEEFFDHLVHTGALQRQMNREKEGNDLYHCPIPSFRTYLIDKLPTSQATRIEAERGRIERGPPPRPGAGEE